MFYCAGRNEFFSFAKPLGVGLIESAMMLTEDILEHRPSEVVFVGSCGCYDRGIPLLEPFLAWHACQIESSLLFERSYTPLEDLAGLEGVSCETLSILPPCLDLSSPKPPKKINSSNYINLDERVNGFFIARGIGYENMEFFSVLRVARRFGIPAYGIFCPTNYIHSLAHEEFVQNHKQAMGILEHFVKKNYHV